MERFVASRVDSVVNLSKRRGFVFPSSEIYRILPYRRELLEGLLHADLVGFHTYDYARHFLSACSRVLDVSTTTPKGIEFGGRFCSIGVFPIGIDPLLIRNTLRQPHPSHVLPA